MVLRSDRMNLLPRRAVRDGASRDALEAAQVAFALRTVRRDRVLVVDGDHQLGLVAELRRIAPAIQVTSVFHQVNPVLAQRVAGFVSPCLSAAICVARCQMPLVAHLAPAGKTFFVPHGVDTDWFRPGGRRSSSPTVLCVGRHCRDFVTLKAAAIRIQAAMPGVSVRLVAASLVLPEGQDLGPVELVSGVSDEQLRAAYQSAWVVLLPVTDATANNSVLEAMACGTPIVTTDVGGIRDYVEERCGALCRPGDAEAHANATIALLADESRRAAAGAAARESVLAFDWRRVRAKVREILESD